MTARCLLKAAAEARGDTKYQSDHACPKGHVGLRLTVNGACVECTYERRRQRYHSSDAQKDAAREDARKRRRQDPAGMRISQSRSRLKTTYGMTQEQYEDLFEKQDGCCAICEMLVTSRFDATQPLWRGAGAPGNDLGRVDHCHSTNAVRGLLCSNCNIGLGKFQDDEKILLRAVRYLRASVTAQAQPTAERKSVSEIEPEMGPRIEQRRGSRREQLSPFILEEIHP